MHAFTLAGSLARWLAGSHARACSLSRYLSSLARSLALSLSLPLSSPAFSVWLSLSLSFSLTLIVLLSGSRVLGQGYGHTGCILLSLARAPLSLSLSLSNYYMYRMYALYVPCTCHVHATCVFCTSQISRRTEEGETSQLLFLFLFVYQVFVK
jgi:hypothetical protein